MSQATTAILSVNSGSSSIKFALYPCVVNGVAAATLTGVVEGLEPGGTVQISIKNGLKKESHSFPASPVDPFEHALMSLRKLIVEYTSTVQVIAVTHRIVHGGDRYADSVQVDDEVLAYLHTLDSLAPLHQPHNLAGVTAFQRAYPEVPQIACFDTGFHADLPELERVLPIPKALRDRGIRRYGFHGLSYRYVAACLAEQTSRASKRVVMAHLGNGASLCGMLGGKNQATTMGFSVLDGLMMGTRCGALDPGVLLHLMRQGWDLERIETTLYKESGLLGVSGISADMRTLRASKLTSAAFAIDLFTHRLVRECGAMTACIGGIDVLAFTGGIGEHDVVLRQQTCAAFDYLGLRLDATLNQSATGETIQAIHASDSTVEIWVVPTDEGRVAALDASKRIRWIAEKR